MALVVSDRRELFENYGTFSEWPHGQGRLSLHSFYVKAGQDAAGNVSLQRTFPSAAYERLNADCKSYLPEKLSVHESVLVSLEQGKLTSGVSGLIERFVALGTPERYGRPAIPAVNVQEAT